MRLGVALGALNAHFHLDVADAAQSLGYESVWLPEHLVLPVQMSRSPRDGEEHPPVPPSVPVFDAFAYLAFLAARCPGLRLGTHVYNLALRHPFVAARAVATLDVVSGGRAEIGIGAGWLEEEWVAAQLDFHTRGRRLDEALDVCTRLWSEPEVEHHGEFFDFAPVAFEPKPVQRPRPPVLIGGESPAALRRAARAGDGWLGMGHTFESAAARVAQLRQLLEEHDRAGAPFQIVVGGPVTSAADLERWEEVGVTRLIVAPWTRSRDAVAALTSLAALAGLTPRAG
jgi:probable F420-dependent oxidoreductase